LSAISIAATKELIGQVVEKSKGEDRKALKDALEQVEKEEDEHLYHTTVWARGVINRVLGAARGHSTTRRRERCENRNRGGPR
jgi:hypothetical protein